MALTFLKCVKKGKLCQNATLICSYITCIIEGTHSFQSSLQILQKYVVKSNCKHISCLKLTLKQITTHVPTMFNSTRVIRPQIHGILVIKCNYLTN